MIHLKNVLKTLEQKYFVEYFVNFFKKYFTSWISASFTQWKEDLFKALLVVSPSCGLEDHGSLCPIGHQETVNSMVNLTAVTTTLVQITDELSGTVAVLRVLNLTEVSIDIFDQAGFSNYILNQSEVSIDCVNQSKVRICHVNQSELT